MDDIRVPMRSGSMDDIDNEPISQNDGENAESFSQETRTRESRIKLDYSLLSNELTDVSHILFFRI